MFTRVPLTKSIFVPTMTMGMSYGNINKCMRSAGRRTHMFAVLDVENLLTDIVQIMKTRFMS